MTPGEKAFCLSHPSAKVQLNRIAARIAVKESVSKALGIGFSAMGNPEGTHWSAIEMQREERQAPQIQLYAKAQAKAEALGIQDWLVSVTHDGDYAFAVVLGISNPEKSD